MKNNIYVLIILSFFSFNLSSIAQNNALTLSSLSSDELTINSNMGLGTTNVTGECWVNIPSASERGAFINVGDGSNGYGIGVGNGNWDVKGNELIIIYNTIHWFSTGVKIGTGWHHIAFTIDGFSSARAFLDGKLVYTLNGYNAIAPSNTVYIGSGGGGRYLTNGTIDEVCIWNIDRGEAEIRADMYKDLVPGDEANLVGYYKFNETSGQILNDETSNNNDGALSAGINFTDHGTPSVAFFGPKNALNFVSDDYAAIPSVFGIGTSSVTIECWVNLSSTSREGAFVHIGDHDVGYGIGVGNSDWDNSGNQLHILFDQRRWIPTGTNIGTGWHHVVLVLDANSDPTVYLDGEEVYSDSGQTDPAAPTGNSSIGSSQGGIRNLSDGIIDEVRIWNDVRTQTEIRDNMIKTLTGDEANLVAYYNLDGNVVVDLSGNGYDGTIGGDGDESVTSTAFNTWLNTNSTSWTTVSNWSLGSVPTATDNVGIYNLTNNPVIASTADCKNLYLESGASITMNDGASFINTGNHYINGTFIINKTLTNDGKWHLISVPNNNSTANDFFGDFLQTHSEELFDWTDIEDESTPLIPGKGYGFYGMQSKANYSFSGVPNNGDIPIQLEYSGSKPINPNGWNLIGNPYLSSIDWGQIDGYGAKYTWNGTAYDAYPATGELGLGSQYAAPFQGFFVQTSSTKTLTFTNATRTHLGTDGFEKGKQELENGIILAANNGNYQDQLLIVFNENSYPEFEMEKDAVKLLSNTTGLAQIYSKHEQSDFCIDIRPNTEIIQLGFINDENGNYSINIQDLEGISKAELEDTKLNTFHDLSQGANEFDWNTTDSEERFILHLKATATQELVEQKAQVYSYNGQIYIRQTSSIVFQSIQVFDLAGRVVYSGNINQDEIQSISLSNLKGTYLVQLIGENGHQTEKVIFK